MNRQAQAVVLLLLGGAVLRASLSDLYLRYVKEGLRPFLIPAGLLLVVAAIMTLWYELRPVLTRADEPADDHDDHTHHEPRVGWLLILPVLGLLLVAPPALGSYAASQSGTALNAPRQSDYPPLPDADPAPVSVLDYAARALFDRGASIGDRRVLLTGFLATGEDGRPILARMVLSCCAADGRPVKLGLTGDVPTGLPDDTWVEVIGRYSDRIGRDPINDAEIPYLQVESWRPIPTPKQQYD
ncbi:TIGR03943 family protein [Micromonospora fiedleri]|uniref:TIGR03943 family protein n=1 Tax=Micromonospora fiedleri TaxID=1157498 RepID=A0ABS1UI34_9ACTN|nr:MULTISPECIES: TIGR03943 family protein [Micromonospora]MBL6276000.1 TIGR03943 family protein [Micromonospora fiedleri]WSK42099.1 TIGR03943 family protein [Micromonospora maris]